MAANTSPIFALTPTLGANTFVNADAQTVKDIVTAGANGLRIDGIFMSSDDTTAREIAFYIHDGTTAWYIGSVTVPIGAGYTTVARVDALLTLRPAALNALILPATYKLQAKAVVSVTAAKTVTVVAIGGNY